MTDRELLELAAKAAGISWKPAETDAGKMCELKFGLWLKINHEPTEYTRRRFNPLTDDGDAFRLAVKLRFGIKDFSPYEVPDLDGIPAYGMVEIWREGDDDPMYVEWYKRSDDRYAATRRAIVRAAAELAKQEVKP